MEKLKKLTLNKVTITNLNDSEMNNLIGGDLVAGTHGSGLPFTCIICTNGCVCDMIRIPPEPPQQVNSVNACETSSICASFAAGGVVVCNTHNCSDGCYPA
jgi:natural product precursor